MSRRWLCIDLDAFFCSVEELDAPHLKALPMAVGGVGMIAAANYVARRSGVRSAMPGFIARRLCPTLVFVKPDFSKYTAMATRCRTVFADFDDRYESGGLDEACLDVTDYCAEHALSVEQVWRVWRV